MNGQFAVEVSRHLLSSKGMSEEFEHRVRAGGTEFGEHFCGRSQVFAQALKEGLVIHLEVGSFAFVEAAGVAGGLTGEGVLNQNVYLLKSSGQMRGDVVGSPVRTRSRCVRGHAADAGKEGLDGILLI